MSLVISFLYLYLNIFIYSFHLCIFLFQGDSGGPVVCLDNNNRWRLAGIISVGDASCGYFGSANPNILTRVAQHTDWVDQVIATNS